jgi:hypothetical protein
LSARSRSDQGPPPGRSASASRWTSLFNTLLNHTAPTAHLGQRRGVVTGGSLNARNRIMNESLWHFVPPSFSAGCGGIDLFAGSFSFISAEQFQNLLRAIAANAAGYAFEVALGAMCKECLETMETLQKKIQALNQGFANSCQLAKGLVNDVADAFDVKHKDNTSLWGMVKGLGDVFETRSATTGVDPIAQVKTRPAGGEDPARRQPGVAGAETPRGGGLVRRRGTIPAGGHHEPHRHGDRRSPGARPGRAGREPPHHPSAGQSAQGHGSPERHPRPRGAAEWDNAWPHRLRLYQCGPWAG